MDLLQQICFNPLNKLNMIYYNLNDINNFKKIILPEIQEPSISLTDDFETTDSEEILIKTFKEKINEKFIDLKDIEFCSKLVEIFIETFEPAILISVDISIDDNSFYGLINCRNINLQLRQIRF
jgi:hypothetical protein